MEKLKDCLKSNQKLSLYNVNTFAVIESLESNIKSGKYSDLEKNLLKENIRDLKLDIKCNNLEIEKNIKRMRELI